MKRQNCPDWDTTYMNMAKIFSLRSKDPSTQVGAVIVSKDKRILTAGYNGTPRGFNDDNFPWGKDSDNPLNNKDFFVIHAELNAILNFKGLGSDLEGATAYVTLYPCHRCAQILVQSGISEVVYLEKRGGVSTQSSEIMFRNAGIIERMITV